MTVNVPHALMVLFTLPDPTIVLSYLYLPGNKMVASSPSRQCNYRTKPQQSIEETIIPFMESQRDLGVTVNLSWSSQCDYVCAKAYKSLDVVRRNVPPNSPVARSEETALPHTTEVLHNYVIAASYGGLT